jgi:hypothetical protein
MARDELTAERARHEARRHAHARGLIGEELEREVDRLWGEIVAAEAVQTAELTPEEYELNGERALPRGRDRLCARRCAW